MCTISARLVGSLLFCVHAGERNWVPADSRFCDTDRDLVIARSFSCVVAMVLFVGSSQAVAQPSEDIAKVQAARDLAEEGYELFEQERYEESLERLRRAYQMVAAPTIKVLQAEALIHLDRYIEAREAYETVERMDLGEDASPAFVAAKQKAAEALAELKPRIPGITVVLKGDQPKGLRVTIDQLLIDAAAIGVRWPVDPGEHVLEVSSDAGIIATREVELGPGEHERVVIVLATKPPPDETEPPPKIEPPMEQAPPPTHHPATWVSFGLGGAGLAVGVGAGAVMLNKKRALDDGCTDVCPTDLTSTHDAFRRARSVSWVGYTTGLAGIGAGLTLLLVQSRSEADRVSRARRLTPFVGPDGAGIAGRF
jgi:hypothetical protein